jgi:hypothetical protein
MPIAIVIDFDLPRWQTTVIPAIGLLAAGLTLLTGRWALRRKRRPELPPPPEQGTHDPFDQGSRTDRRRSLRRKGNPVEILLGECEATREPLRGWVLDRSTGGLCLLTSEEIAPGTMLRVRACQAPPGRRGSASRCATARSTARTTSWAARSSARRRGASCCCSAESPPPRGEIARPARV